jgi:hypothetical protein
MITIWKRTTSFQGTGGGTNTTILICYKESFARIHANLIFAFEPCTISCTLLAPIDTKSTHQNALVTLHMVH